MRYSLQGNIICAAFILASWAPAELAAANRVYLDNQAAFIGDTGVVVPVHAENDQERHGFSLSIKYDQTLLSVKSVTTAGTAAGTAEWTSGRIVSELGAIQWGVAMDLSDPLTNVLPVGSNLVLLNITVDVIATVPAATAITPQDKLSSPEGGWLNLFSTRGVNTVPLLAGGTFTIKQKQGGNRYQLGNCNGDGEAIPDITDAIFLLGYMFLGGEKPPCEAACDTNSDASSDLSDAVSLLSFLFQGGPPPQDPFPACATAPVDTCAADTCGG